LRSYKTNPQVWGGDLNCSHEWGEDLFCPTKNGKQGGTHDNVGQKRSNTKPPSSHVCEKCGAWKGELGLEPDPKLFVAHLTEIFREVRRVLRHDGTCWVNIGDSYAGSGRGPTGETGMCNKGYREVDQTMRQGFDSLPPVVPDGMKTKDIMGIPWMLAFSLREDGWFLRQDIIWRKINAMPESVTDRCTKAHEYVFLLSKSGKYFYDYMSIATPIKDPGKPRKFSKSGNDDRNDQESVYDPCGRYFANKRSVWDISLASRVYGKKHFAIMAEELASTCIKPSVSQKGCCPKCRSPWERVFGSVVDNLDPVAPIKRKDVELTPEDSAVIEYIEKHGGDYRISVEGDKHCSNWKDEPIKGGRTYHFDRKGYSLFYWGIERIEKWVPTCQCGEKEEDNVSCTVLDPFSGSGTTGVCAIKLGHSYLGLELNPEYYEMSREILGSIDPIYVQEGDVLEGIENEC